MIFIDVSLQALAGKRDELREFLLSSQIACAVEDGCQTYRWSVALDDPDRFHLIEVWRDESALKAHLKAAPFQTFIARVGELGTVTSSVHWIGEMAAYTMPLRKET